MLLAKIFLVLAALLALSILILLGDAAWRRIERLRENRAIRRRNEQLIRERAMWVGQVARRADRDDVNKVIHLIDEARKRKQPTPRMPPVPYSMRDFKQ